METSEQQITMSASAVFSIFRGSKTEVRTRDLEMLASCRMYSLASKEL
jgi:hypothetical protein